MNTALHLITVAGFLVIVWYVRLWFKATLEYKDARRAEIKRRLQVEHKQEQALKQLLAQPMEDAEKFKIVQKFANERHERAVKYVIQDMFEHNQ